MDKEVIKNKVNQAIAELQLRDNHLLVENLNERAITHKLAVYLQRKFRGYDVDCEYNGNVFATNRRKGIPAQLSSRISEAEVDEYLEEEAKPLSVYPDIIVHKRGRNDKNVLIIEVKKSARPRLIELEFDEYKLRQYTNSAGGDSGLLYKLGCFVEIVTGSNPNNRMPVVVWFENGERISE